MLEKEWKKAASLVIILLVLLGAWYWYQQPKFIIGESAPDFSFQNLSGQTKRLAEFRGKYVLLHFWGSWCGPCRKENPSIVALHEKYHTGTFRDGYGLEIVSIGMETNPDAWRKAIIKDKLTWMNHYSDLQRLDGLIAKQYRVTEIPTTYLLDPKGTIMGVNFSLEQMEKLLDGRK
jgi:thiol-disulfide isomerase/thioredoxin